MRTAAQLIHGRAVYNFPRRHYVAYNANDFWQIDLADFSGENSPTNRGYLLVVVDVHTRKAYARIMRNKSTEEFDRVITDVAHEAGAWPKHIHSDQEGAFNASSALKEHNVNLFSTPNSPHGAAIAERMIRTIKTKLEPLRYTSVGRTWKHHVAGVMESINNTPSRGLMIDRGKGPRPTAPNTVTKNDTMALQSDNLAKQFDRSNVHNIGRGMYEREANTLKYQVRGGGDRLAVGSYVLTQRHKAQFEKGYVRSWNKTPYVVAIVKDTHPTTYMLRNMTTGNAVHYAYYRQELKRITKVEAESLTVRVVPIVDRAPRAAPEPKTYNLRSGTE